MRTLNDNLSAGDGLLSTPLVLCACTMALQTEVVAGHSPVTEFAGNTPHVTRAGGVKVRVWACACVVRARELQAREGAGLDALLGHGGSVRACVLRGTCKCMYMCAMYVCMFVRT